jgi:o-succinylbenzoate synthase
MSQGLVFYNPIQMAWDRNKNFIIMEDDINNLLLKGEPVSLKTNLTIDISERVLHFKQPAGTSRGTYLTRRSWCVTVSDGKRTGVGECAPLPNLSCDYMHGYALVLQMMCDEVCRQGYIDVEHLRPFPSMLFGLETAFLHMQRGSSMLFDTPFGRGEEGIPINGLVWMGSHEEMLQRMEEKIKAGFHCVKLKIGAIGFDEELDLIRRLRGRFSRQDIELRVDANGAFMPEEALEKLEQLARYDIHSIEQPIRQGQWTEMARLCRESPLPIALDEELIGVNDPQEKARLLDTIKPAYIILKPSLHGGMAGSREWIALARERGIGSWITSALESNIGLNAIAHFTAHTYGSDIRMPQGLGTGQLFSDNIPMPLEIRGDRLWTSPNPSKGGELDYNQA